MRRAVCLSALGAALLAAGCGQKGPLYLPDRNAPVVTAPATQPQPSPGESAPAAPAQAPAAQPKTTDKDNEDSGAPK
jgi:predicted small lipoprotein YifL